MKVQRKVNGITPTLPTLEDREAMKKIYKETGKVPLTADG